MKNLFLTAFILVLISLTSYSQENIQANPHKPKAIYKVGSAKVTVWENNGANGTWKNFKVEKFYKKDDQWKTTSYFDDQELLELRAAIDKAIAEENVKVKTTEMQK